MGARLRLLQRARQVIAGAAPEVPSPCVSVCRLEPDTKLCEGCLRTLEEIAAWSRMGDDDKRAVWRMIGERVQTRALASAFPCREQEE